ncbi:MAG: hypothetical protein QMD71_09835 [bacterium]|nr:hypothetical protein [bacterium]
MAVELSKNTEGTYSVKINGKTKWVISLKEDEFEIVRYSIKHPKTKNLTVGIRAVFHKDGKSITIKEPKRIKIELKLRRSLRGKWGSV